MTKSTSAGTLAPGFNSLGLDDRLLQSLTTLGYEEPTPVQREAIPMLISGVDVLGQAATGTGKTAAFALPILQSLATNERMREPMALILVPTRELAMQVAEAVHKYGKPLGAVALPIYGGAPIETQLRALKRGVDIVVATPGRALDHIRRKTLKLGGLKIVVLDEADEMLDMGFAEDLEAILEATPSERQTALFSATMAPKVSAIAAKYLRHPKTIRIAVDVKVSGVAPKVRQVAYIVPRAHKMAALGRVLDIEQPTSAMVFCRTRTEVDALTETLNASGYRAAALHGGLNQQQRDRVMKAFRANTTDLLVATDVAARGIDVEHVSHVVNYDVPSAPDSYVHRIGRTGRAGREGVAITLAEPREHRMLRNIESATKQKITISAVPTVADLRTRRLEATRANLREAIVAGDLEAMRGVVESLASEFDVMDVAAAAVKLVVARESGEGDQREIPTAPTRTSAAARPMSGPRYSPKERAERAERAERPDRAERVMRSERPDRPERPARPATKRPRVTSTQEMVRLFIGGGRKLKIRPGDIVGAIANEMNIAGEAIGAIEILDRHSLVDVPSTIADEVVTVLRGTTIKGKKLLVRRDLASQPRK